MIFDIREYFMIFIRGILMGAADSIPGVSGGTIALITGIYAHLIEAINGIQFKFLKSLFKCDFNEFLSQLTSEIDFKFFTPLILGIGGGFLTLAKIITYCLDVHTALTYSLFLGLIMASALIIFKRINKINIKDITFLILGFMLTYIFVSLNPISTNHSLLAIFLSGLIAICAMILPGISGSFILLLLGQYKYMLTALREVHFTEIICFIIGAIIGILSFSKIINFFLKHYEEITMSFLIGVMIGSLKAPTMEIIKSINLNSTDIAFCIAVSIIGFALTLILETKFNKN